MVSTALGGIKPPSTAHFPPRSPPFPPQRLPANCARLDRAMSVCEICNGVGLVRVMSDAGLWVSRACECQESDREERRLAAARIPERYRQYTLDGYETAFRGADQSLSP